MIAQYNADSRNVQMFFQDLINFAQELGAEQKRAIACLYFLQGGTRI
ncbi:hypothetical protein [Fischerella thermalis]